MASDLAILKIAPDAERTHLHRIHDHLPQLFAEARPGKWATDKGWPDYIDDCVDMAIQLIVVPPTPNMMAGWRANTPAGHAAYRERNRQLHRLARYLLESYDEEVSARPPGARKTAEAKATQLRAVLAAWAEREELIPSVAPPPRPK